MTLAEYMDEHDLTDEQMAQKVRALGVKVDRSTINRLRNDKQWLSRDLAAAMPRVTGGKVTANDFVVDAPPMQPEAACAH